MNTTPEWLQDAALQKLFAVTAEAGGELRAVGGAVRDFLLGDDAADVDFASTLPPEDTMALAQALGHKAVPTGLAHGTVTLVLPERVVEVTTLRRDVETDGRHAVVAYTSKFEEDAARRDFTMNALYIDSAGKITDYFGGKEDLAARRVKFIGDAGQRIREDGLRILRFFRFLASHGMPPADAEAMDAIRANLTMLDALSGERIAAEMRKLLGAANPAYALRLMQETGVAAALFGRSIQPGISIRLQMLENQSSHQASVWARALALLPEYTAEDALRIGQRWKLSRHEQHQLTLLAGLPAFDAAAPLHHHTRLLRLHGAPAYMDWLLMQAALKPGTDITAHVLLAQRFVPPVFPVTAKDLLAQGMTEGKALGEKLAQLEQRWEMSDYALDKAALLAE